RIGAPLKHGSWVNFAAFNPDDTKLVTASIDRRAAVWELTRAAGADPVVGRPRYLPHSDAVKSAEFSPDGRWILTGCLDRSARIWSADNLDLLPDNPILRQKGRVNHAAFSADGRCILISGTDGIVSLWDLAGGIKAPVPVPFVFSADGQKYLAVA